jgi:hypothetical protein
MRAALARTGSKGAFVGVLSGSMVWLFWQLLPAAPLDQLSGPGFGIF